MFWLLLYTPIREKSGNLSYAKINPRENLSHLST